MHPNFSVAKIEKKVCKLREQMQYLITFKTTLQVWSPGKHFDHLNILIYAPV
jgi:hypothetical protein